MRISGAVNAFGGAVLAAVLVVVGASFYTVEQLRVGGPIYNQVVLGKDLVADILPPPEYVIEAYLETRLALDDPANLPAAKSRLAQLHKDYNDRHAYWIASPLAADLKTEMVETSDAPVQAFWKEVEQVYLPALESGDQASARASLARIAENYQAHRKVVDHIVVGANAMNARLEADAARRNALLRAVMIGAGVLAAAVVAAGLMMIRRGLVEPVRRLTAVMGRLASGENGLEIPLRARADEVGDMAKAVEVFRDASRERHQMREQQEQARLASEQQREAGLAEREGANRERARVMEQVARGLARLSAGDLSVRLSERFPDEYEALRTDFNAAVAALSDTLAAIVDAAAEVKSGTGEIVHAADDLTARTVTQAAALEQSAAALNQITVALHQAAESADHAHRAVADARDTARSSSEVVGQAVEAMDKIEQSSRQIGQIIGVIDEIAFQTNLLALNAGVEAARAGEAGKGFAVVASEVRALAQRSAEAAKEIKGLVSRSSEDVTTGVGLVAQTGEALGLIAEKVAQISGLVLEVSGSAKEQAASLDQVNAAVGQMDQATQENGARVEQAANASHVLSGEAERLNGLVGRFQVGVGGEPQASPARDLMDRVRRELAVG
jgi:methyl-accepting chemotaxis protein